MWSVTAPPEVNLEYSDHLHDIHNDYPVAPEHTTMIEDMLSDYNRDTLFVGQTCLIPNLNNKVKYVTRIKNLKLYKQLGLVVTKIYRVLAIEQAPWLNHTLTSTRTNERLRPPTLRKTSSN